MWFRKSQIKYKERWLRVEQSSVREGQKDIGRERKSEGMERGTKREGRVEGEK